MLFLLNIVLLYGGGGINFTNSDGYIEIVTYYYIHSYSHETLYYIE
jgi:hypothetical protein